MPSLVRRLVHATTSTATHVGLPAGEAVQLGGYDGVVVAGEDHHAVPRGVSVWEMGTNQDVSGKANGDYAKRTAAPPVSDVGAITPVTRSRGGCETRASDSRRLTAGQWSIGDVLIGEVLSGSPVGADGAWPVEAVRELTEALRSDELERGLWTGKFNQRGVVVRNNVSRARALTSSGTPRRAPPRLAVARRQRCNPPRYG